MGLGRRCASVLSWHVKNVVSVWQARNYDLKVIWCQMHILPLSHEAGPNKKRPRRRVNAVGAGWAGQAARGVFSGSDVEEHGFVRALDVDVELVDDLTVFFGTLGNERLAALD